MQGSTVDSKVQFVLQCGVVRRIWRSRAAYSNRGQFGVKSRAVRRTWRCSAAYMAGQCGVMCGHGQCSGGGSVGDLQSRAGRSSLSLL